MIPYFSVKVMLPTIVGLMPHGSWLQLHQMPPAVILITYIYINRMTFCLKVYNEQLKHKLGLTPEPVLQAKKNPF